MPGLKPTPNGNGAANRLAPRAYFVDAQQDSAPISPTAPMPAMMPAVAVPAVPAHFGGHLL
jgi:hypothetical protein